MSRRATQLVMPAPPVVRRTPAHGGQSGRFRLGGATEAAEPDASRAAAAALNARVFALGPRDVAESASRRLRLNGGSEARQ